MCWTSLIRGDINTTCTITVRSFLGLTAAAQVDFLSRVQGKPDRHVSSGMRPIAKWQVMRMATSAPIIRSRFKCNGNRHAGICVVLAQSRLLSVRLFRIETDLITSLRDNDRSTDRIPSVKFRPTVRTLNHTGRRLLPIRLCSKYRGQSVTITESCTACHTVCRDFKILTIKVK